MVVKRTWMLMVGVLLVMLGSVSAQAAGAEPKPMEGEMLRTLRWQLALEREGFSPGMIDGCLAGKTLSAVKEYQRCRGLPVTGKLDEATGRQLGLADADPVAEYTVQSSDAAKVTGAPGGWVEKSKKRYLGYRTLLEAVAEKHHCTQGLLGRLNRGKNLSHLRVGDTIRVPRIEKAKVVRARQVEVDLSQKVVRAIDERNRLVGLFHCSIAAKESKRPRGQTRIVGVTENPSYTFDPAKWPEVKGVRQKLLIPPGPRNPVGLCWIGLGLPGYGIHGTPNPELIGKTGSHGCFRLSNWDATRLGRMVRAGTPVKFVG